MPPAKVRMGGKSWDASFQHILVLVIEGLGCEEMGVLLGVMQPVPKPSSKLADRLSVATELKPKA